MVNFIKYIIETFNNESIDWNILQVKDMLFLCESIYTSEDFFKMERIILRILNFDLNYTEPLLFLIYYSHKLNISEEVNTFYYL